MTKTETILHKICEVLELDFRDVLSLFTYEIEDSTELNGESFFQINYREALNVTLFVGLNANSKTNVSYTPADGSTDGDYGIVGKFDLPTTIRVWSLMSRQLIDLRRTIVNSVI